MVMLSFFLFVASYDVWFYVSHIILHKKFHKIHKIHHSIDYKTMIVKDTYVAHYIESPFQGMGILFPLLFIPFQVWPFLFSATFVNLRGMLRHDHRFVWIIGNHHILHHKHPQYNFGEYWIDKFFGTVYPNSDEYVVGMLYL